MVTRSDQKPEDSSEKQISKGGPLSKMIDKGRSRLCAVTMLLCCLIALVGITVFWWFEMTLLQAALLTVFIQLSVFLVIMLIGLYRLSQDKEHSLHPKNPEHTTIPDLHIWRSYSHDVGDADSLRIAVIAEDSVQTRQIATDLAQLGYDLHHTTDVDAMLDTVLTRPVDWEFMIFDLDLFDDLKRNVEELVMFREDCPRIPILLLSGSTSRDESSDHHRAIGDATLRKPVFRKQLLAGIDAMRANWEAREFASEGGLSGQV